MPIFHKTDLNVSEGLRHYIKFAFYYFSKYSSKIKNLHKSWLKDSFSAFVFPLGL